MATILKLNRFLPPDVIDRLKVAPFSTVVSAKQSTHAWKQLYKRAAMQIINVETGYNLFNLNDGIPTTIDLTDPPRRGCVPYKTNGVTYAEVGLYPITQSMIYFPYGWRKEQIDELKTSLEGAINEILSTRAREYGYDSDETLGELIYEKPNAMFPKGYRMVRRVNSSSSLCHATAVFPGYELRRFNYDAKDDPALIKSVYVTWSLVEQTRADLIPHMGRLIANSQCYMGSIVLDQYDVYDCGDYTEVSNSCWKKQLRNKHSESGVMDTFCIAPAGNAAAVVHSADKMRDTDIKFSQHDDVRIPLSDVPAAEIAKLLMKISWSLEQQDRSKVDLVSEFCCCNCNGLIAGECYAFRVKGAKTDCWRLMHPICAHIRGMASVITASYSEVSLFTTPISLEDIIKQYANMDKSALLMVSKSHFNPQLSHSLNALIQLCAINQIDIEWAKRGVVVTENYIFADSRAMHAILYSDEMISQINEYYNTPGRTRIVFRCFIMGFSPPEKDTK